MAINFEAANMAGYNNPKIEVFKATLENDGNADKIVEYPPQPTIVECINRGSIPFILLDNAGSAFLLSLHSISSEGDMYFIVTSKSAGEHILAYTSDPNEPPVYQATM